MDNREISTRTTRQGLALGLALLWLAGCMPSNAVEQNWGNSVRNNIAQQILNPQAGKNNTPVAGLSPQAAVNEMENYNKSFKSESQQGSQLQYSTGSGGGQSSGGQSSGGQSGGQ